MKVEASRRPNFCHYLFSFDDGCGAKERNCTIYCIDSAADATKQPTDLVGIGVIRGGYCPNSQDCAATVSAALPYQWNGAPTSKINASWDVGWRQSLNFIFVLCFVLHFVSASNMKPCLLYGVVQLHSRSNSIWYARVDEVSSHFTGAPFHFGAWLIPNDLESWGRFLWR